MLCLYVGEGLSKLGYCSFYSSRGESRGAFSFFVRGVLGGLGGANYVCIGMLGNDSLSAILIFSVICT